MSIYVYALKSLKDKRIYVGQAVNVTARLKQHNNGTTKSTRYYIPWKIIYSQPCKDRKEARGLEKYLKSGCGKEFLKSICACSSIG